MARIDNLSNFLTDVATSIKEKKGTQEPIPAANFDTEIASIETGVDTSDATATAKYLVSGKTAYANGEKIEGVIRDQGNSIEYKTPQNGASIYPSVDKTSENIVFRYQIPEGQPDFVMRGHQQLEGEYVHGGLDIAIPSVDLANQLDITADKIVKGNTVLGVEGTAEVGGENNKIKLYGSKQEMLNDTNVDDGTLGLVYNIVPVDISSGEFIANAVIVPRDIPKNVGDNATNLGVSILYNNSDFSGEMQNISDGIHITGPMSGMMHTDVNISLYKLSEDGTKYTRGGETSYISGYADYINLLSGVNNGSMYLENYELQKITKITCSSTNNELWNYVKFANIDIVELYQYHFRGSDRPANQQWSIVPSLLDTVSSDVIKGHRFFSSHDGAKTGTKDLSVKRHYISIPYVYGSNITSETIDNPNSYGIAYLDENSPTDFGDKRYILAKGGSFDMPMYMWAELNPDDIVVFDENMLKITNPIAGLNGSLLHEPSNYQLTEDRISLHAIESKYVNTEIYFYGSYDDYIATNAEIQDSKGNVLVTAGPKASTLAKGNHYINIFGEKVEGTMEAGTISSDEYDQALTTANEIKGGNA